MTVPYGSPGNPARASVTHGTAGGLAALVSGCCAGLGSILGVLALSSYDKIHKPDNDAGDYRAYKTAYDAWQIVSDIHDALDVLLAVSAVLAAVLIAGGIQSLRGKPSGRQLQLVGGGWVFVGGLITMTFGGEHGLAFDASLAFLLLVPAAVFALVACAYALIPPPLRPAPQFAPQQGQPASTPPHP